MKRTENSLEKQILSIQKGDADNRSQVIEAYRDFIKSELSKVKGTYIEETDDLFSVGLSAFNEAIDRYNGKKGGFISFAGVVIRSRSIDHLRKIQRAEQQVTSFDEGSEETALAGRRQEKPFEDRLEVQLEIEALKERLFRYDITFEGLVERGPKQERTRKKTMKVAKALLGDRDLKERFERTGRLPVKALRRKTFTGIKTIEQNREYIIALYCILDSDLEELKTYLPEEETP